MKSVLLFVAGIGMYSAGLSQSFETNNLSMKSTGEVPLFLMEGRIPSYVFKKEPRQRYCSVQDKNDWLAAANELLSSGFVLFGTSMNQTVDEVAKKYCSSLFADNNHAFYIFRSTIPTTFHVDGNMFITTGLLARLRSEKELAFWLGRELVLSTSASKPTFSVNKSFLVQTLDDVLTFYTYRDETTTLKNDKEVAEQLRNAGFTGADIKLGFESMREVLMPFGETVITPEMISSPLVFIPGELLTVQVAESGPRDKPEKIRTYEAGINARMDALGLTAVESQSMDSPGTEWMELVTAAQVESIRQSIARCEFATALYKLYSLEEAKGLDLDTYKALAWLGVVEQEFGPIKKRKEYPFFGDLHPSSGFLNFYYLMNGNAKVALALRNLTDLKNNHPEDKSFARMQERALEVLSESGTFDPTMYSKKNWQENEQSLSADNLTPDSREFYLYALSDLVKSDGLRVNSKPLAVQISRETVVVNGLTKTGVDEKRTSKIQPHFTADNAEQSNIERYNFQEEYGLLMLQSLERSVYEGGFIPVNFEALEENEQGCMLYHQFEGRYAVRAKKTYFLALSVIGIPYVCADLMMGSQLSWHTYVVIDRQTGAVVDVGQDFNRDYLTKKNIERRQETLKNTYAN